MRLVLVARASMSAARALAGVLTPIYLAVIGFTAVQLGALFTLVALVSAGLSALVGLLADRLGRKPFLIALPVLTAAAGVAFALTRSPAVIIVAAAAGSFGRGAGAGAGTVGPYQPAEQAYLADAVPHRARNDLFGRLAFMSSLGGLIGAGPLAALPDVLPGVAELGVLASYRVAFLVMAGLALAAGLLVVPIAEGRQPRQHQHLPWKPRRLRLSGESWRTLWRLWLANSLNGLAVGFFGPFITYWFYVRFRAGPAQVGILYAIVNLAAMASNLGAAPFARRLGLVRAIVLSRSLQALLIFPMVLAPSFWLAGAMYLVRMMAQRLGLPLRQSYVMGVVPAEERGAVAALSNLPSQGTSAIGPTLAGYLFSNVSLALPFEIGAALQGASTLLFYVFFRTTPPPEERTPDPTKRAPAEAAVSAAPTATADMAGGRDAWLDAGTGRDVC
jgi:MFS family permease